MELRLHSLRFCKRTRISLREILVCSTLNQSVQVAVVGLPKFPIRLTDLELLFAIDLLSLLLCCCSIDQFNALCQFVLMMLVIQVTVRVVDRRRHLDSYFQTHNLNAKASYPQISTKSKFKNRFHFTSSFVMYHAVFS